MQPYPLVLVLVMALYLFSPAILEWWSVPEEPWYRPYLIWLALVALIFVLHSRRDTDEL